MQNILAKMIEADNWVHLKQASAPEAHGKPETTGLV